MLELRKFNALFSYLPIDNAKIKPCEILSRQNREIKYQYGTCSCIFNTWIVLVKSPPKHFNIVLQHIHMILLPKTCWIHSSSNINPYC